MQAQVETETIALSGRVETGQFKDAVASTPQSAWVNPKGANRGAVRVVLMARPQGFDEPIAFEVMLG